MIKQLNPILALLGIAALTHATEYHVSPRGNDQHSGTANQPLATISKGAELAQPGDVITVHAGLYRERINPPRGGTSDAQRIVYQAAAGEEVVIKGSEVVANWQPVSNGVWRVILPNSFFGAYNPYTDVIAGDWFKPRGRVHHTGEVYLDGAALAEEVEWSKLLETPMTWLCAQEGNTTTLSANFGDANPADARVEINVRPTIFYPDAPGRDYITVRGFTMRHAASQWAPPTAEQPALMGTHWSKGWIIEDNVISDAKCVGVTLGKYGDAFDNTSADRADGYVETIHRALERGWTKETVGSHLVRNNTISHCGAAGICGSLGAIFSEVSGNHLHDINLDKPWTGHEMAAIKFHAPIDMLIRDNRIHHTTRGIWLDWMTQGTRVTGNLLYDNGRQDIYIEVNHGPFVVDNNIFMTPGYSLKDVSQGGAYLHNLFLGEIKAYANKRLTPYHKAHSTELAGMSGIQGGDNRFYNNIIVATNALAAYTEWMRPILAGGNLFVPATVTPPKIIDGGADVFLEMTLPRAIHEPIDIITTDDLGRTAVSRLPFMDYDGQPLVIDHDYLGAFRGTASPGPLCFPQKNRVRIQVWPKGQRK